MTTSLSAPGDQSFVASYLVGTYLFGSVIPPDSQSPFSGTYEIYGDIGSLVFPAVVGDQGVPGPAAFALKLENDMSVDDPSDLPQTLQNSQADIGKFWLLDDVDSKGAIIGASAYIWYGLSWRRVMLGTPGPPGPCPIITPSVDIIPPDMASYVDPIGGTPLYPTWNMNLSIPVGPTGPAPAMALCPDVDLSGGVAPGDVLGYTGRTVAGHLSPPTGLAVSHLSSGGSLSGEYFWMVTVNSAAGESTPSNECSTTVGTGSTANLIWDTVPGADSYNLYRGLASGGENHLIATVTTNAYADTGATGTLATPPATNGATVNYPVWVPVAISQLIPSPYSMPEASFTGFSGLSQRAAIGSFPIPPQAFPWTPVVWGHLGAFGLELSANPLQIGVEIRLGDPTSGALIGRGFGNDLGEVNCMPHYSDPSNPGNAITPTNGLAVVPANHSNPAEGTLYFNLFNDGAIGLYQFSPTDAQGFVMVVPVSEPSMMMTPALAGGTRRRGR
ncbi:MAG TPA: hypothetical protein VMS84_07530 [Mycobacterium sp.]|jgi:hypothetical protein|nr:hypothetical protein [Mycobacterium sp.]